MHGTNLKYISKFQRNLCCLCIAQLHSWGSLWEPQISYQNQFCPSIHSQPTQDTATDIANTVIAPSHHINHTSLVSSASSSTSTVQGKRRYDDEALPIRILWDPATPPWESGKVRAGDGPGNLFRSGSPFIQCLLAERILTVTIFPTSSACLGSSTYNSMHMLQCTVPVFSWTHNDQSKVTPQTEQFCKN
jgi:hypothetical protein